MIRQLFKPTNHFTNNNGKLNHKTLALLDQRSIFELFRCRPSPSGQIHRVGDLMDHLGSHNHRILQPALLRTLHHLAEHRRNSCDNRIDLLLRKKVNRRK